MIRHHGKLTLIGLLAVLGGSPIAAATGDIPVGDPAGVPIRPPLPVWPSDYETIGQVLPTFRVNGRFGATAYRVELATSPDFAGAIRLEQFAVSDPGGITPVVLVPYVGEPLVSGRYYWRAFAGNDDGYWTVPANHRVFDVVAPAEGARPPGDDGTHLPLLPVQGDGPVHPRLLVTRREVSNFRAALERSPDLLRGWYYQYNAARGMLDQAPPAEDYARAGAGQHGNYSTAASWYHRHLENMAFVAQVTADEKFIRKGVEMLMAACAYERWLGPLFDDPQHFDPPWTSALETAMMTEAVAVGYDLLHEHLSDEQRRQVRDALADKGVRKLVEEWADPVGSSRLPRHQLPTGNWVMVCSCSGGMGALALLGEHPEAERWSRLVRDRVRAWLRDRGGDWYVDAPYVRNRPSPIPVIGPSEPNFGVDGGYKESIGYMNYAMRYVVFFADALKRDGGGDLFADVPAGLLDPMAWSIMHYPQEGQMVSSLVDFGDCGTSTAWYDPVLVAMVRQRHSPLAAWLYQRVVPLPRTVRTMLWHRDDVVPEPPDTSVPMGVFHTIGQVVMRSGWSPESPMAAIKFHQNRGHLDLGTIYLFGGGGPTIVDSGVTAYGGPIYGSYSAQSRAHNVILVDDKSQQRVDGRMLAAVGTSAMTAASGQLAAAYPQELSSWTRDLLMLPGGVAVVQDRVAGRGEHRYEMLLHPFGEFELKEGGGLRIGPAVASTQVSVHSDRPFTPTLADGYIGIVPRKYVRYPLNGPAESAAFLTVCRWPQHTDETVPDLEVKEVSAGRWRIDRREGLAVLAVRAGGADDGLVGTDARLAAVWVAPGRPGAIHAVMFGGTRLMWRGKKLLEADSTVDVAAEFDAPTRVHAFAAKPVRLTLPVPRVQGLAWLDGVEVASVREKELVSTELPAGEHRWMSAEYRLPFERGRPLRVADLEPLPAPDAPAYGGGIRTAASTSHSDVIDAVDGDVNTSWASLPGLPMPQWMRIDFGRSETLSAVDVVVSLPCRGRLETLTSDRGKSLWADRGTFQTTPERQTATVKLEPAVQADGLRVVIEEISAAQQSAHVAEVRWR